MLLKITPLLTRRKKSAGVLPPCGDVRNVGFTSRPLYLEAQFFESRPVQRFLGRDCITEINDDRLGRALDQCYHFGCDRLFAILASQAAIKYGVSKKFRHMDSTSPDFL
jgi:transposase